MLPQHFQVPTRAGCAPVSQEQGHPEGRSEPSRATRWGPAGKNPLAQHLWLVSPHNGKDTRSGRPAGVAPFSRAMHVCRRASGEAVYRTWPAERKFKTKPPQAAGRKAPPAPAAGPSLWPLEALPGLLEHPTQPAFVFFPRVKGQPSTHRTEGAQGTW